MSAIAVTVKQPELHPHPTFKDTLRDISALTWRAVRNQMRTPEQFFDVTLAPVLFTLMFTYIFGGAVAGSVADYLPLIIPGLLAQTLLQASGTLGGKLREDMEKGVFDRFRAMPISRISPLASLTLADLTRFVLATLITLAMGLIMGWRPGGGVGGVVLGALLCIFAGWCLSWMFCWLGTMLKSSQGVQGISMMIIFPLSFLSNAFVDPATMPGWLQAFVKVNPVTHVVSATRDLMNDFTFTADVGWAIVGCLAVVAIFAPLAVRGYRKHV